MWIKILTQAGDLRLVNLRHVVDIRPHYNGGVEFNYADFKVIYDTTIEQIDDAIGEFYKKTTDTKKSEQARWLDGED